ncbi:unnamed protein product, partial [Brenthis ino]
MQPGVSIGVLTEAYRPSIKIYEIRESKSPPSLDDQYYDPENFKLDSITKDDVKVEKVISKVIAKLQNLSKRERDNDKYSEDDEFVDKTRNSPLLIVRDDISMKAKTRDLLQRLLGSVLRSRISDVEDRTAPPRPGPLEYYDY